MKALQHWEKENKQNFTTKFADQPEELQTWLDFVVGRLEQIDPTPHKEYAQWIVRAFGNNPNEKFEDYSSRGADALAKFNTLKIKKILPADKRDINRLRSLGDLENLVSQFEIPGAEEAAKGQSKVFYEDGTMRVIVPLDMQAAMYYGQGTRWCTAAKNDNRFDSYNKNGPMYIILPKKPAYQGEKYQLHFPSSQYMDPKDEPVDLNELKTRFPQLVQVFEVPATEDLCFPLMKNGQQVKDNWHVVTDQVTKMLAGKLPVNAIIMNLRHSLLGNNEERNTMYKNIINALKDDIARDSAGLINSIMQSFVIATDANYDVDDTLTESLIDWLHNTAATASDRSMEYDDETEGEIDAMGVDYEMADALSKFVPLIKSTAVQVIQNS